MSTFSVRNLFWLLLTLSIIGCSTKPQTRSGRPLSRAQFDGEVAAGNVESVLINEDIIIVTLKQARRGSADTGVVVDTAVETANWSFDEWKNYKTFLDKHVKGGCSFEATMVHRLERERASKQSNPQPP